MGSGVSNMHRFIIRGTRGTMPACGHDFAKYGGNTTCFSLETDEGMLIFDAGTGIMAVGEDLAARSQLPPITILFTHFHLDHVIGLPCFSPVYNRKADLTFMADGNRDDDWRDALNNIIATPYWPTSLSFPGAEERYVDLPMGSGAVEIYGARISWCPVFHPQGSLAYRIDGPDKVIVIATDHEHAHSDVSAGFLEFCRGADFLLYDAMYTPEEYADRIGWGHGNWMQGVQLAMEAEANTLILTHHDPRRTDTEIDEIVRTSQEFFPETRAATEHMVLSC